MELRRITQTELHEKTGIGKSSISTYLKGEYKAKQDKVDIIAEVLHVDPTWLMGYDVPMNKPYQQVPPSTSIIQTDTASSSRIIQRYAQILKETPEVEEVVESYVSLDTEDRAEIRGELKGMLKADKYSYTARIKDDTAM